MCLQPFGPHGSHSPEAPPQKHHFLLPVDQTSSNFRRQYKQTESFLASGGDIDDTAEPRFSPMLSAGNFTVVGFPLSL